MTDAAAQAPDVVPSPLLSLDGAVADHGPHASVAAHYGAPLREGRALEDGRAFVDLSSWGVVTVTGPDRLSWLHNLSSQALDRLEPGASTRTLFMDLQGRIEFDARVLAGDETVYLIVEPTFAAPLAQWLDSMRFMLRVEVKDVSGRWAVLGSTVPLTLPPALLPDGAAPLQWQDPWPRVEAGGWAYGPAEGHPGDETEWYLTLVPRDDLAQVAEALIGHGFRPAGTMAAEAIRIAAWEPSQLNEVDQRSIPHELDLLRTAVHLSKGCYKGQETVARVHNLGHPPRRLVFLDLDGSEHTLPAPGAEVHAGGRRVGVLTSSVLHHDAGPIGLAVIRRAVPEDAELTVVDGEQSYAATPTTIVAPDAGNVVGRPKDIRRLR